MSFELLSEPIRRFVREKGWEELRPIQLAAIQRIMTTDDNYILASRTASGKTEAAFLPILSRLNFKQKGVQILYISPLIALINDQFERVEQLCKYLDIPVTKWHGEANKTKKEKLVVDAQDLDAQGIVLITPESIEAMLMQHINKARILFEQVQYVVVDEIHAFIGTDRGRQLQSLLSRLREFHKTKFIIIGLSATIGSYEAAKAFTGDAEHTRVLLDKSSNNVDAEFKFFGSNKRELPVNLLKDIYLSTSVQKALIFPNSRGRVEEIAVKLRRISDIVQGHTHYYAHHASVAKVEREAIELFAKSNIRKNFCIVCTSTLELGIDIGSVDTVVQVDATHSISSLVQRVGRSARRNGNAARLILYATTDWNLLQATACFLLYQDGFIEPPQVVKEPFDVLLHQALSIVRGLGEIEAKELISVLRKNAAFEHISITDISEIIVHLLETDLLEDMQGKVFLGIAGEKLVGRRDFYTLFQIDSAFSVYFDGGLIGELAYSPQIREGDNIMLSAQIWCIEYIDFNMKKIAVKRARSGDIPNFGGGAWTIHERIRQKMMDILYLPINYPFFNDACKASLSGMQADFSIYAIRAESKLRPVFVQTESLILYTFSSSKINRTLQFLLEMANVKSKLNEFQSSLIIEDIDFEYFKKVWAQIPNLAVDFDAKLLSLIESRPHLLNFSKFGYLLPDIYKAKLMSFYYFDFIGAIQFVQDTIWVEQNEDNNANENTVSE